MNFLNRLEIDRQMAYTNMETAFRELKKRGTNEQNFADYKKIVNTSTQTFQSCNDRITILKNHQDTSTEAFQILQSILTAEEELLSLTAAHQLARENVDEQEISEYSGKIKSTKETLISLYTDLKHEYF